ncbi:hypothetical protein E0H39_29635 [Rhizobium leguminosarum bv. viciae]|uniref:hypothetical protein n=1 Tax=Rhizobium leguminosarum TaxID=384 RepID=UPI00103C6667|nr:hypothetical protein [Rhizobium leguminosarum]TBY57980.1 hypothetical protein E0H39_29635 [Rhizobium leguminosarum bv. viciae]
MPHVRTQLRNAVKTRLSTVPSLKGVYNMTRHLRGFQSDNLPAVLVAVEETSSAAPGSFEGARPVTRDYRVHLQVVLDDIGDAEDAIDAVCVDVEKAMVSSAFGIGAVQKWKYEATSAVVAQPTEDSTLITQTLLYSGSIQTLDAEPDRNLHP